MTDIIIIAAVALIAGLAGWYIYRSVKAGKPCIGCPHNGSCGSRSCGGCRGKCPSEK